MEALCPDRGLVWSRGRIVRPRRRIPKRVGRNFNWIWYVGAAAWFFDAAWAMHRGALGAGLSYAGLAAIFLAAGLFFRRSARRPPGRDSQR